MRNRIGPVTAHSLQFTPDISVDNDAYVDRDCMECRLAALLYVWNSWESKTFTTTHALEMLLERIRISRLALEPWLFVGTGWCEDNRVSRYKTIWKRLSENGASLSQAEEIQNVIFSSRKGIKQFGLMRCTNADPGDMASLLRSGWETQLIFAEEAKAEAAAARILANDWKRTHHMLGSSVRSAVCDLDLLAFVPFGEFDDGESGAAVLARRQLLERIFPELIADPLSHPSP
jgi:hypothetical protein